MEEIQVIAPSAAVESRPTDKPATPAKSRRPVDGQARQRDGQRRQVTAAAIGGSDGKRRSGKRSAAPLKKVILAGGIILCIVAIVIIVVVVSGGGQMEYEISQTQFTGSIQLDEIDDSFVSWSPGMQNINSADAQKLVKNIKPRIISAYRKESFVVEDVLIKSLTPTPPKTIKRNEVVSGRAEPEAADDEVEFDLDQIEYVEKTYDDVQSINADYETIAKPTQNAAMFGSIKNDRWPRVKDAIQTRLASTGIKARLKTMKPAPKFMKAVSDQIKYAPESVTLPETVTPKQEKCDCRTVAFQYRNGENVICECEEGCGKFMWGSVIGGEKKIFSIHTSICKSAYYAGIITEDGGNVELVHIGEVDRVYDGPEQRGIKPRQIAYRHKAILLKAEGEVIPPTTPAPGINTGTFPADSSSEDGLFIVFVRYKTHKQRSIQFKNHMRDLEDRMTKQLCDELEPKYKAAAEDLGFKIDEARVVSFEKFDYRWGGLAVSVRLFGDIQGNAAVAAGKEDSAPGSVGIRLLLPVGFHEKDQYDFLGFRYSTNFMNAINAAITQHKTEEEDDE